MDSDMFDGEPLYIREVWADLQERGDDGSLAGEDGTEYRLRIVSPLLSLFYPDLAGSWGVVAWRGRDQWGRPHVYHLVLEDEKGWKAARGNILSLGGQVR